MSDVVSYFPVTNEGCGSTLTRSVKSLSSTINFVLRVLFVLSINSLRASLLFINQPCLGSFKFPYLCLTGKSKSGTGRSFKSNPTKLSNHLRSISLFGTLTSNPSVTS